MNRPAVWCGGGAAWPWSDATFRGPRHVVGGGAGGVSASVVTRKPALARGPAPPWGVVIPPTPPGGIDGTPGGLLSRSPQPLAPTPRVTPTTPRRPSARPPSFVRPPSNPSALLLRRSCPHLGRLRPDLSVASSVSFRSPANHVQPVSERLDGQRSLTTYIRPTSQPQGKNNELYREGHRHK